MSMAIVYRWTRAIPGREREGMDVLRAIDTFAERMIAEGKAASKEWVNLWTDVWENLLIVRGEPAGLFAILAEPEHRDLLARSAYASENLRTDFAEVGSKGEEVYASWAAVLERMHRYERHGELPASGLTHPER